MRVAVGRPGRRSGIWRSSPIPGTTHCSTAPMGDCHGVKGASVERQFGHGRSLGSACVPVRVRAVCALGCRKILATCARARVNRFPGPPNLTPPGTPSDEIQIVERLT